MSTSTENARDFFISYTSEDQEWAEWIAWQLEEAGYTTILQVWDFAPGAHFVTEMHRATQVASRTIAILSRVYIESSYAEAEWQEAWRNDPRGSTRKLLVFRIEDCARPGLLGQLVSVDLFGLGPTGARSRLLAAVREERRKPDLPPDFPHREPPSTEPPFPGRLVPAEMAAAMHAGGPATPDNAFAVALAWWYAVLQGKSELLDVVITPESRGEWDLAELRAKTAGGGVTTAVMKPCYDVAYVRLAKDVGEGDLPLEVAGGQVLVNAMIISLVLRPELGGWRVHAIGQPLDPEELPRTWK